MTEDEATQMNPIIVLAIALRTFVIPVAATALDQVDSLVLPVVIGWTVLALLIVVGFARVGLQRPKNFH
jgi:hypothetical protein